MKGKRVPMKRSKDKKVFANTAVKGRAINFLNNNGRGGKWL